MKASPGPSRKQLPGCRKRLTSPAQEASGGVVLSNIKRLQNRDTSMLEWWPKRARELEKEIALLNGWRKAFKIVAI